MALWATASAHAGGWLDAPKPEEPFRSFWFVEAGANLNQCPQISAYFEFRRSWEMGLETRSWFVHAFERYAETPETDLHVRKLWLGEEKQESLRGAEYLDLAAGAFPGYRNDGTRAGFKSEARATVGKYWMPGPVRNCGLDLNLTYAHYFSAHPTDFAIDLFTATLSVFYVLP